MADIVHTLEDFAAAVGRECHDIRMIMNSNAADLNALQTINKTSLVGAINELKSTMGTGNAVINDNATTSGNTWSAQKINTKIASFNSQIDAAMMALRGGVPSALDTLGEIASAIGNDANFAATINAALAKRVRVDTVQTFSDTEKARARTNIGAVSSNDIGPDTDFLAIFNNGLL